MRTLGGYRHGFDEARGVRNFFFAHRRCPRLLRHAAAAHTNR